MSKRRKSNDMENGQKCPLCESIMYIRISANFTSKNKLRTKVTHYCEKCKKTFILKNNTLTEIELKN